MTAKDIIQLERRIEALEMEVAELTEAKQAYDAIVGTANDSIFIKNSDFQYTFINPAMERTLGLKASDLIGKTPEEVFGVEEAKIIALVDKPVLEGKIVNAKRSLEINGVERMFHTVQTPAKDVNGKVVAICGIVRDVTELKLAEEALKESEEQLRSKNEELRIERHSLNEKNIALKELLEQIGAGKEQVVSQIKANIDRVIMPIIRNLSDMAPNDMAVYVNLLKQNLSDVASPFISHLESGYSQLTLRQIEICNMIKSGMSCKEISVSLSLSVQTVLKQRSLIRKRLGIAHKKINLTSFLQSMD